MMNDEIRKIEEEINKKERQQETEMRAKGFKFKTTLWIHPRKGDDYSTFAYTNIRPTASDIAKWLKRSAVKNDYRTDEL